ncbi:MAG: PAS domain S-box protein [Candidatus Omnitrophica bacterium]|nr:PAS domain S-box protein [Candidatus Omnitrophota bacterium]
MLLLLITNLITLFFLLVLVRKHYGSLRERKSFLKLVNNVNIGYYRYRYRDGVVINANKGFVKVLELDELPENIIGRSLSELIIYVDEEGSIRKKVKEKKFLKNIEYHFKTLKGKDKWVIHNSRIALDPVTRERVIDVLIEDITEEKVSYEKMKESQERYEKLFKSSGDMVIVYDFDSGIMEEINPITEVTTGYSANELIGKPFEEIIHPSYRKRLEESRQDLLFQGMSRGESVMVCHNGHYREVMMTFSLVELDDKRIVVVIIKDISKLVKEKEDREKNQREMEEFCRAAEKREERIKDLRKELDKVRQQLKARQEMDKR